MVELAFESVSKVHADGTRAVDGASLTLPAGRLTTLLGPSGSGKTTLLRLAAGLEAPTSGRIRIDGADVTDSGAAERPVSLLFQNYALFPHLDVAANVAYGLRASGLSSRTVRERCAAMLDLVGLQGLEHRQVHELSGGQQQRVALARALALQPSVMLLDEPLSNLDGGLRRRLRDEIRELQRRFRLTMGCVSHDESDAMALSDHLVVLDKGRVLQAGPPREVYERPVDAFVAEFLGDAAIFEATRAPDGGVMLGPLRLPLQPPPDAAPSARLRVMVRPQAWQLMPATRSGMSGRIEHAAYLGRRVEYRVKTELGPLLVLSQHAHSPHQPGSPVSLALGPCGIALWAEASPIPMQQGDSR